jgi:chromosome segregation ATPase
VNPKDQFAELERKIHQAGERLKSAHQKHADQLGEMEHLRSELRALEQEIKGLKKERELVKNRVEQILSAISRVSGE